MLAFLHHQTLAQAHLIFFSLSLTLVKLLCQFNQNQAMKCVSCVVCAALSVYCLHT